MCIKDTGTKYQLWISDFNIDGTFTRVHPFIISHTKTMTRTREDGKEEVFSACIKPDDARYLGGNKNSSVNAIKLQGRPRTGINYDKANEFCANRGDWITMIDYFEYCALQALCYIEYANFGCFCLTVALIAILQLALVAFVLVGFGRILVLMSASLP